MLSEAEVLEILKENTLYEGRVIVDGKDCTYAVVNPRLEQRLPNFVGMQSGAFFISAETPEEYRDHIIKHEIRCLSNRGQCGHCLAALKKELAEVPDEIKIGYVAFRLQFFFDLVSYKEKYEPDCTLLPEIRRSLAYLETDAL